MSAPTVVVGASLAGLRAVEALRLDGDDTEIVVVGAEAHMPYDRPPLSKKVLTDGDRDPAELTRLEVAADLGVEWRLATAATGLDLDGHRVTLAGGEQLEWGRLVIATGAHARRLPALGDLSRVHVVRTLDDAVALRADLRAGPTSVAIIGAGFIGLEVASSCRDLGVDVTVIEALPVPLERAVGAAMGARIAARHRQCGIKVETGIGVDSLEGVDGVEAVRLADGRLVAADVVVVGVGVSPNVGWLEGSGVDLANGVRCDSRLRVLAGGRPLPDVVAAGDVACWDQPGQLLPVRVEHWTNAVEQGDAAAKTLLRGDEAAPFAPVPYFWSDQLGVKLQMVGRAAPGDDVAMLDDDGTGTKWLVAFGRDGRVVAALGAGRPAKVMKLRRAIDAGDPFPPEV
ncbi:FAD-dependent oxidoreductase [Acidiferrimicrobium sp. IK]|uniref:NAD(P)/FAD-dependent oxidoreductase n=1 Tax=Acidiferrimicrobium sp. IK TaxID=2871700 RepID=UPI0021CB30D0|nr:FAD-dependent oxidoreductase [Acidiferrimicrobium sp. IK]MCU4184254.1 FAD-dependent oxidoreductase [Acidiferrimicrobium sp. IK]